MTYKKYLKNKFINLFLINQKIGKSSVKIEDFDFLNKAFSEIDQPILPTIRNIEQLFSYIESDFNSNLILKNKIGLDFLEILNQERKLSHIFLKQTPLEDPKITIEQKQDLEKKYTELANKYGLKEFYYSLNPNLTSEENYDKAILLLNKTEIELTKLQETLDIEEPYKIGNGILSIQVNWQEEPQNNGYYNYCSNTICLKDENSTFPLIHEYVHFIDKTTTCLLLTGKTSQQLYEEEIFTQAELFYNFDMSVFSKIEFNKDSFPWITTLKLKSLFKKEINQNKYMQEVFNKFDSKKDYRQEFKDIMFNWIEEKQYPNKELLKNDINEILTNKLTQFNVKHNFYNDEEKELIGKTIIFNIFNTKQNNTINWSKEFDLVKKRTYYITQKEMLARTIEQATKGNLQQLSDRLTTPVLSNNEKNRFFELIKSWQDISLQIINIKNRSNISSRISSLRQQLEQKPQIISQLKLK